MNYRFLLLIFSILSFSVLNGSNRWTVEQANEWYATQPFLMGCNYIPSTAINQLEMWQESTWDPITIDRELGWASKIGFNTVRVFLHNLLFEDDKDQFLQRIDDFLAIATKHGIKTMFVFWDDCHWAEPKLGKQPEPIKGVHNSGWKQSPGYFILKAHAEGYLDPSVINEYELYVKTVLRKFKNDDRVLAWDLYNEIGQGRNGDNGVKLLLLTWKWAWEVRPSQPLTACTLGSISKIGININMANSDVYSYHSYLDATKISEEIRKIRIESEGRPIFCTEYLARNQNSTFEGCLPIFKKENIANWCWGLVDGKTGTKWDWNSRKLIAGASSPIPTYDPDSVLDEPKLWFHDVLRKDGTPFNQAEVTFIKNMRKESDQIQLLDPKNFDTKIDGKQVSLYTLRNRQGMVAQITNFGGRVVSLWTPDRDNNFADIVTGFKSIAYYQKANEVFFGALIGRYGNRIANGKFMLNGTTYTLPVNNGKNTLHGGPKGFHNVVWEAHPFKNNQNEDALELKYLSKDGEEGFPGNLLVTVTYTLTNNNKLRIDYSATTDKPTVVNLTHHSFFNLFGFSGGIAKSINSHILKINAPNYTPTDDGLIPTGEIAKVKDTPMDFTRPTAIGERVNTNFTDLKNGKGYDHNWILNKHGDVMTEAAVIYEPSNGRQIRVMTDQPALQFYGGNFFEGKDTGKYGEIYTYRTSFALETQHYPDSPNHSEFPSTVLNPSQVYHHTCVYKFEVKN